ncbi:formate dehydrogenase accessory sulfurtransferase FdhD [Siminovitchia sediminis]|uniref:Sulfur carrier protein FdhD n=1 Tax=Siminovitchia sediminis TaxID=1274353 RepID=A0ABW4KEF0_9BACI
MDPQVRNRFQVLRYTGESLEEIEDQAAVEYPLTIYIDHEEFATIVCTPTHIRELTIGFLASEGLIRNIEDISSLEIDDDKGMAYVELKVKQVISKEFYSKRMIGSCCGKSRQFYFYNDAKTAKTIMTRGKISAEQCLRLMKEMQEGSEEFQLTGGVHNAALGTPEKLLFSYSDIGRHNALDKIFGHCLNQNISLKDKVIVFSGRISSEVVLKVSKIGIGILISKSAPTTLGIHLARDLGITAIGFARDDHFNIYSHPERIIEAEGILQ